MKKLYIIRGLPGSGKTTLAKTLCCDRHKEADMFFTDEEGNYHFNYKKLKEAHDYCYSQIELLLLRSDDDAAVSNTFTCKWEYEKYIELAHKLGFQHVIIECQNDFGSVHSVPDEVIKKMRERFER